MSRRRRRVKIKSSSRLFAFILFNLLLLASCITAHYLQEQTETVGEQLPILHLGPKGELAQYQAAAAAAAATQGISSHTASSLSGAIGKQRAASSILASSQFNSFQDTTQQAQQHESSSPADSSEPDEAGEPIDEPADLLTAHRHHQARQQQQQQQQQQAGAIANNNEALLSVSQMCLQLPASTARHLKLCKLIGRSPSADEALAVGAARGLAECRNQFKWERWNCTHAAGDQHLLTSRLAQSVGNRESGFVQAIAAAGIVHSIATACSIGSLSDCACDKTRVGLIQRNEGIWKWGGCSNNIRHGMLFARHLVELLDAVHEQARHQQHQADLQLQLQQLQQQQQQEQLEHQHAHLLQRRSLSSRHREPNQLRGRSSNQLELGAPMALLASPAELLQQQQQMSNFCQRNANMSQSTQIQLIKSLLARNSLERHQDFRLAMNRHNNRVGLNVGLKK